MFILKPPRDVLWAIWHEDMNKHFLERREQQLFPHTAP